MYKSNYFLILYVDNSNKIKKMTIQAVSSYIVLYCHAKGIDITPLKLQKLLYYVQSWHLVFFDRSNIFDDVPEAWMNGPVYSTIYADYFHNQGYQMNDLIQLKKDQDTIVSEYVSHRQSLGEKADLIDSVLIKYAVLSSIDLVLLTHNEIPWNSARAKCETYTCKEKLSLDEMYSYYKNIIEPKNAVALP